MDFFYQALQRANASSANDRAQAVFASATAEATPDRTARRQLNLKPSEALFAGGEGADLKDNLQAREQCRVLRTRLLALRQQQPFRSILITSAVMGEGKTFLAANLALSFSKLDRIRVLLMDADLRKPELSTLLCQKQLPGLELCLTEGRALNEMTWRLQPGLDFLSARSLGDKSTEALNSQAMRSRLQEATAVYDIVIVDGPPLLPIADSRVLAGLTDATLMVVRSGKSQFAAVGEAAQLLDTKLLGVILNDCEAGPRRYGNYEYYKPKEEGQESVA